MLFGSEALAQRVRVTGTVTSEGGTPLQGVAVRVDAVGDSVTTTNETGRYTILAPSNGNLRFTYIGYRAHESPVNGRTRIDVAMERLALLDQVVVTAYSGEQRRSEITGAVASVNVEATERMTSASVLQRLDANVTGVTVNNGGAPGSRSTVRIRGISSFQNNNPLYIVDGTPVQDDYVNFLNPNDISSIQVLKDASSASIYGSRASNGVVIIETNKGGGSGAPRARLRARTGLATPVRGYDDFLILNSLDYYEIVRQTYVNAGQTPPTNIYGSVTNPTVPAYIWPNNCGPNGGTGVCSNVDVSKYSYPSNLIMPGSQGTNWWDAVFGTGKVADLNLDVSGGGANNAPSYAVSFNYFDQTGTSAYSRYSRGSVRVNTAFTRGRFNTGENFSFSGDRAYGELRGDAGGETGILGKNILSQPVVPVYDINGNFASGKAVGLGNNTNPLKSAYEARNNINLGGRIFGNVFAGYDVTSKIALRSVLGLNAGQNQFTGYSPITPENSEPNLTNSINENEGRNFDYTWSNTLRFNDSFWGKHNVSLLLGQEANRFQNRFLSGQIANLINTDVSSRYVQDALGDAATKNVSSSGGKSALLSYFGRADYNYEDRYTLSATVRRDGSSRLGPGNQWGTFPAFGAGWRVSQEPFMKGSSKISDLMLRVGYGVTGNQQIPAGRITSQFGGSRGSTFYDITGSDHSAQAGYRQTSLGNQNLKWEESRSINGGLDVGLWNGAINVVLDVYKRTTDNLLFNPATPATAGTADPPIVNIGKMSNKGFDLSVGHRGSNWDLSFNGSRYTNKIERIDGSATFFYGPATTRFGNQVINQVGSPISSFYGYVAEGLFRDQADVDAHAKQDGKPGRIKFKDVNGDGQITLADRTIIGNPHPDFTAGLDGAYRWRAFELAATVFGSFGNDIWDAQKEFYVFHNFSTNVRRDLLTDSWTPEHPDAKYPRLDQNDAFSSSLSSFYVEDGSYVRLRNLQLSYNVPARFRMLSNARVYVQGENLFTITGYDGLDPALPVSDVSQGGRDVRDQYRGIDRGVYPSNRTFSIGFVTSF